MDLLTGNGYKNGTAIEQEQEAVWKLDAHPQDEASSDNTGWARAKQPT